MNCVVTAGPTFEPLDAVRRLTNFSTGRLGSELAAYLTAQGHRVTLLIGEQATWRGERRAERIETFTSTADLEARLRALSAAAPAAVFHAAAVSDFTFGKTWLRSPEGQLREVHAGKISTRQGTLLAELVPTPKILARLRDVFPTALIVGWKYEVDGTQSDALAAAQKQLQDCRINACVANGPAYGPGFSLVQPSVPQMHLSDLSQLLHALEQLLACHQA